jgi:hypothetical protein
LRFHSGREYLTLDERRARCGLDQSLTQISAQIDQNSVADLPVFSYPLLPSNALHPQLEDLNSGIHNFLDEQGVDWSSIDVCHRRRQGVHYGPSEPQPVLLVAVNKSNVDDWEKLQSQPSKKMYDILPKFLHHEIGLELIEGQSTPLASDY